MAPLPANCQPKVGKSDVQGAKPQRGVRFKSRATPYEKSKKYNKP